MSTYHSWKYIVVSQTFNSFPKGTFGFKFMALAKERYMYEWVQKAQRPLENT